MKVVITAATQMEWQQIKTQLHPQLLDINNDLEVIFHTSGIGVMAATFSLQQIISEEKPELVIQVGIAGAFPDQLQLCVVVVVKEDQPGDLLVEENGRLNDLFDMDFLAADDAPYLNKKLPNPWLEHYPINAKKVTAVTINEITTNTARIAQLQNKYGAALETMEGAALHYVCLQMNIPFLQIRAISNEVGERNKQHWQIKEALQNLSATVIDFMLDLQKQAAAKK